MRKLLGLLAALTICVGLLFTVSRGILVDAALNTSSQPATAHNLPRRTTTSQTVTAPTPPPIVSISVCSTDSHDGTLQQGTCTPGTFDTHQLVLGPQNKSVNLFSSGLGVGPVPDEHSTVYAPNTLDKNPDYLFFLSTGSGGHANIGVSVLSGGKGPQNGQWILNFPSASPTPAYGWYANGTDFGPVFETSTKPGICPGPPDTLDETFDMHYASAGSIVKDPTASPGSLLMVYEGTNGCIGSSGGDISGNSNDYISLGIATSIDYGRSWPTYRGNSNFAYIDLPNVNQTQAPNAGLGKWGADVCMGNCPPDGVPSPTPPANYGRYVVVTPTISLDSLMTAPSPSPLTAKYGEQEISGFVDDVSTDATKYVYANWGGANIARAALNGGTDRLTFWKWNGADFTTEPGIGGNETNSSLIPTSGDYVHCGDAKHQNQFGSSISYVEQTHQYLLTFVCISNGGDPQYGYNSNANKGAAWFYATAYDLSHPQQFMQPDALGHTQPQEIDGTWSDYDLIPAPSPSPGASPGSPCPSYKGFYPSFMSLDKSAGHLSIDGYVFYLWGCQGGGSQRQMSSRQFKITTTDTTPPVTTASVAGPLGLNGWYTGPTAVSFSATDDLSGVATTEYSLDNGATWTTGTSVSLTTSAIHTILYHSIDVDENVETPKSITVNLDSRPPAINDTASPSIIYNNVRVATVTVSGTINDGLSGVDPTMAKFAVHDEYGRVQPNGPVTVNPDGSFSFMVALRTFVRATDTDGRLYTIRVTAADKAGNTRTTEAFVTAKRFKAPPPPPCKTNCV